MNENNKKYELRELLDTVKKRPGIIGMANEEKRIDYLCYYLDGWSANKASTINYDFVKGMAHWIYKWICENNEESSNVEFSFLWYKMIYSVVNTEEEAWELFFKLSYAYLDQLEAERKYKENG